MAVMLQAFYWDAPKHEKKKRGEWWNFIAEKVGRPGQGRIQRALAAAGLEGLRPYLRRLRPL